MIDLAASVFTFPCAFPIKAIGRSSADFRATVVSIIRRHAPDLDERAVTSRASGQGSYLAISATFTAHSREQLDALYVELSGHEQVLWVL
jgi:putative lipoic acid-binding regulatory protein